jgi:hypothetical protein
MKRGSGALGRVGAVIAALAGFAALAGPAAADSFYFGFSSGGPRHYYGDRHYGPGYYGPRHYGPGYYGHRRGWGPPPRVVYYGYPYYYAPPPRAVYVYPRTVPVAPPPVVYFPVPRGPAVGANASSPVYQTPEGQYCREYQGMLNIGGQQQPSYGTACLQPDGSWRLMN